MFIKKYYACITSEPYLNKDKTSSETYCNTSDEHCTLESLLKEIEEKQWAVGNKWKFEYFEYVDNVVDISKKFKTRHKLLKIKDIEYYCKKEKIIRDVEKLSSENDFKEKEPSDKTMCLDVDFCKNNKVFKTYTVITDGKDYMQKIDNYLRERGLDYPENDSITINNIKPFKKEFIV